MKEKTTIPKKVKGTVLFTVVAVMMVLIVFLTATLALAATANNRAYRNYQKKQTEANAKAALDSVIRAINDDDGSTGGLKEQISKLTGSATIPVTVQGDDGLDVPVTISLSENKTIYNQDEAKWVSGKIYEVKADCYMTSTGEGTTYCAYLADDSIANGSGNTSAGGGAFVAVGGLGGNNNIGTSGYIAGGTEIGVGNSTMETYSIENTSVMQAPFYVNGNLNISTQSTVRYSKLGDFFAVTGNFTTTNGMQFEYDPNLLTWDASTETDYYKVPCMYIGGTFTLPTNQITKIGSVETPVNLYVNKLQTTNQTNLQLHGDLYMFGETETNEIVADAKTELYTWVSKTVKDINGTVDSNYIYGNVYCKGNLVYNFKNDVTLSNGTAGRAIGGSLRVDKDLTIKSEGNAILYVGENLNTHTIGNESNTNQGDVVVGGTLLVEPNTTLKVNGDIYANDIINNGTIDCTGTVYTVNDIQGNPLVPASSITGSTREWYTDLNITDIHVIQDHGWGYQCQAVYSYKKHSQSFDLSGNPTDAEQVQDVSVNNSWVTVNHPWGVSLTPEEIQDKVLYDNGNGIKDKNATDASTAISTPISNSTPKNAVKITNVEAGYGKPVYPDGYDGTTLKNKIITTTAVTTYPQTMAEITQTLPDPTGLVFDTSDTDTKHHYDTTKGYYYIENTSGILQGGWSVDIYIKATTPIVIDVQNFSLTAGHSITVEDGATVYFFVEDSMNLLGGNLWTLSYKNMIENGTDSAGNPPTVFEIQSNARTEYYPDIVVYSKDGASFDAANGAIITAHFRAQGITFNHAASGRSMPVNTTYNQYDNAGNLITTDKFSGNPCNVIGQLICKEINVANNWGMMFVTLPKSGGGGLGGSGGGSGGSGGSAIPDELIPMYYNYY